MLKYIKKEIPRIINRTVLTWEGVKITWIDESSFSQWVMVNIASVALTFAFDMSPIERALIIGFGLLILVVELINTGIEAAIDRISEDIHPLSKKAKDVGCAAVGLMAFTAGVVWLIIAIPKLM